MIGKNNITFHEEQQFRQVWIWILLLLSISLLFISFMVQQFIVGRPFGVPLIFGVIFGFGFPIFFYILNLTTELRDDGLYIRFFPLHLSFHKIPLEDLKRHEVRIYNPIMEYGGWGIKYGKMGKAYNVSGNRGIQLDFTGGKRLLIGSQKPEQLDSAIEQYLKDHDKNEFNIKERRETI